MIDATLTQPPGSSAVVVLPDDGVRRERPLIADDTPRPEPAAETLARVLGRVHELIALQTRLAEADRSCCDVMQIVTDEACRMVGAEMVAVARPVGEELEYRFVAGEGKTEGTLRLHPDASLTGWSFRNLQSARCDDIASDPRAAIAAQELTRLQSLMTVPLVVNGRPIGVLCAASRKRAAFTEEDLTVLEMLGGTLAAAVASAEAHAERRLLLEERAAAVQRSSKSDALFRALAEHSDEVFHISDREGVIRYVSPSVTRLLGWQPSEVEGKHGSRLVHPDDRATLERDFLALTGHPGRSAVFLARLQNKAGEWRHIEATARNLTHISAVGGIATCMRDVTDKVRAAGAIEFQAKLLATVEQAVIAIDMDHRITFWNAYAERLYGFASAEAVGANARDLLVAREHARAADTIMNNMASGESFRGEFECRRKDGSAVVVDVVNTPIFSTDGRVVGFVGVSTDTAERRALEEQLRQAQKMEAVGQLAGGVAHDFNNVLTAISSYSELLYNDEKDPERRSDLMEIKNAAHRGAELTKKLLAFSRKQVLTVETVDVVEVVHGIERMLARVITEDIRMQTTCTEQVVLARADRTQLEQVLLNLVVNARDAMPAGGVIHVSVDAKPDACVLRVSDTGQGMSQETQARIFEPFYTTKPAGKGTGLGLSVVYGIVRQLGGSIQVESRLGVGTTMTIRLPRVRDDADSAVGGLALKPHRLLLAHANADLRALARRVLEREGYDVVCAESAEDVARRVKAGDRFSVLVTDMPEWVRAGSDTANSPATRGAWAKMVLMSPAASSADADALRATGGVCLPSPWTPRELVGAIRSLAGTEGPGIGGPAQAPGVT